MRETGVIGKATSIWEVYIRWIRHRLDRAYPAKHIQQTINQIGGSSKLPLPACRPRYNIYIQQAH